MCRPFTFLTIFMVITLAASQKGNKFLLAFPPRWNLDTTGEACEIIINTNHTAEVNITFHDHTDHITVNTDSFIYSTNCTILAPPGQSDKAVLVESDVDISVQVFNDYVGRGDVYLGLPSTTGESEYVLATPGQCGIGTSVKSVFTIAAEIDNTQVEVYAPVPGGYDLIDTIFLNSFDTYTNNSAVDTGADFTAWIVRSNKPISVITGSSCFSIGCSNINTGYIFSPPTNQAGSQFIIPKIASKTPGISGFYIRVISFSQNNVIRLPDQSITENLQSGEFYQYYSGQWDEVVRVDCKERCMVVLINSLSSCSASEGNFLIYVTPLDLGTDNVQFTAMQHAGNTPQNAYDNFITVIATTLDVQLDNTQITGWRFLPDWAYFEVSLEIEHGSHNLQASDGGEFVAFVYGHVRGSAYGHGSAIVHAVSVPNELPGKVPTYRISLISDWSSAITMDTSCVTQYSNQLRQKTLIMGVDIHNLLGETLCTLHDKGDMSITSSSSSFFSSTNSGVAYVSFILKPAEQIAMGSVLLCAEEIATHAKPHTTWGIPLLDSITDCADPVFHDEVFYDGENEWICENEKEYEEYSSIPSIFIELRGVGNTSDSSDLTAQCTIRYSTSLDNRALTMRSELDTLIGNQLCAGMNGLGFASPQTSLTAQGSSALVHIDYILTYGLGVNARDALFCAEEVREYLLSYDSWGVPLLPPESGCPNIDFTGTHFPESSRGWLCNILTTSQYI